MLLPGANLHTSVYTRTVKRYLATYKPACAGDLVASPCETPECVYKRLIGAELASCDHEAEAGSHFLLGTTKVVNALLPLSDPNARWASPEESQDVLSREFPGLIRPRVRWREPLSDAALVLFVTQGLGAHLLTKTAQGYTVDLSGLARYRVRPTLSHYGARLDLSPALEPVSIEARGAGHRPGDATWEVAKLVFRASVAAIVTIRDHALYSHFKLANSVCVATRKLLPPTHPVRVLLKPFLFRTAKVNWDGYVVLLGRRAIFHRLFAFDWRGLTQLYADASADFTMRTVPDELLKRGVHELENFAYGEDATRFWLLARAFVEEYLGQCLDDATVAADSDLARWHAHIRGSAGSALAADSLPGLVDLCTVFIYNATAGHEHVGGSIGDFITHPGFATPTLQQGRVIEDMWASKNTLYQCYMLGALTNLQMPRVLEDYSRVLPDQRAWVAMQGFQAGLKKMAREIARANETRAQPLRTFEPEFMEISVSI